MLYSHSRVTVAPMRLNAVKHFNRNVGFRVTVIRMAGSICLCGGCKMLPRTKSCCRYIYFLSSGIIY